MQHFAWLFQRMIFMVNCKQQQQQGMKRPVGYRYSQLTQTQTHTYRMPILIQFCLITFAMAQ